MANPGDSPWPMLQGNAQHDGGAQFYLPSDPTVSETANFGSSRSSAVVDAQGNVIAGLESSLIFSFDPTLQNVNWNFQSVYPFYALSAIGPDGTIYGGSDRVIAFSPAGVKKWEYQRAGIGMIITVPLMVGPDSTVYFIATSSTGQGTYLIALDANGKFKWEKKFIRGCNSCPAIGSDGTIYIGSEEGNVYAIHPDGSEKWSFAAGGWIRAAVTVDADDTIYVAVSENLPGTLLALRPDCSLMWSYQGHGYTPQGASAALAPDGTVYMGFYALHAIDPQGNTKWVTPTAANVGIYPGNLAVAKDGSVCFGSQDRVLFAYDANGQELWRRYFSFVPTMPALSADGVLYVGIGTGIAKCSGQPVVPTPQLSVVNYSGAPTLKVTWGVPGLGAVTGRAQVYKADQPVGAPIATTSPTLSFIPQTAFDKGAVYTIKIAVVDGDNVGPYSASARILTVPPTINSVVSDGVKITASITTVAQGLTPNGSIVSLYKGEDAVPGTGSGDTTSVTFTPTTPIPSGSNGYALKVASTYQASQNSIRLITAYDDQPMAFPGTPSVIAVSAHNNQATLIFNEVDGATGYEAFFTDTNGDSSAPVSLGHSRDTVPLPTIQPDLSYVVTLRAILGIFKGPDSLPFGIIVHAPVITNVTYDGKKLVVAFDPVVDDTATQYTGIVMEGKKEIVNESNKVSPITFPDVETGGSAGYTVVVLAQGSNRKGPLSEAVPVVEAIPSVLSADVKHGEINLTFTTVAGAGPYVPVLIDSEGGRHPMDNIAASPGSTGLPTISDSLSYKVVIAVVQGSSQGPDSLPFDVIVHEPAMTKLAFDGTELSVDFGTVIDPGASQYNVIVKSSTGVEGEASGGVSPIKVPDLQISNKPDCTVTIQAVGSNRTGPVASGGPLVTNPPSILSGNVDDAVLTVTIATFDIEKRYYVTVKASDGTTAPPVEIPASPGTLPLPEISADLSYEIYMFAQEGIARGPDSLPFAIVVHKPVMTKIYYDAVNLHVSFDDVIDPRATEYSAEVLLGNDVVKSSNRAVSPIEIKDVSLDPNNDYEVRIRALGSNRLGPNSDGIEAMVWSPTILKAGVAGANGSFDYSGAPKAASYLAIFASSDGSTTTPVTVDTNPGVISLPTIQADFSYVLKLSAVKGIAEGPYSIPFGLIVHIPVTTNVNYDGDASELIVDFDPLLHDPTAVQYNIKVSAEGEAPIEQNGTTSPITFTGATLKEDKQYSSTIQAVGSNVTGPISSDLSLISAKPSMKSISINSADATIPFNTITGDIAGYDFLIKCDDGTSTGPHRATETPATVPLPSEIDFGKIYTVGVRAVADIVQGPYSAWAILLLEAPSHAGLGYSGEKLVLDWHPVTPPTGATGFVYRVQLFTDDTPGDATDASQPPYSFPDAFAADTRYYAKVQGVIDLDTSATKKTYGPWSADAIGPLQSTLTFSSDHLGRLRSLEIQNLSTTVYDIDDSGNIKSITTTVSSLGGGEENS